MTIAGLQPRTVAQEVTFCLYRDIHKGIRSELFDVTRLAGNTDPSDCNARAALHRRIVSAVQLLDMHAEHEDKFLGPAIEQHLPDLAERVETEHRAFEARCELLLDLSQSAVDAGDADTRRLSHLLYQDFAVFTSTYLPHQDMEERVLMPGLEAAIGLEEVLGLHQAILASIPPGEMARSLSLMLPAMNLLDRVEMLGGMRATAPAEVFQGVLGLANHVLDERDYTALVKHLEV